MTDRIRKKLTDLNEKNHAALRRHVPVPDYRGLPTMDAMAESATATVPLRTEPDTGDIQTAIFRTIAELETPLLLDDDNFGFHRGTDFQIPPVGGNVTPNYERIFRDGFDLTRQKIRRAMAETEDAAKLEFGRQMLESLDMADILVEKMRARAVPGTRLANALERIPRQGAETLYEALLFMQMSIYLMRLCFCDHIGLGRFDQYLYPYYCKEKERGTSDEAILELIEEFFICLNYDTDLYNGLQPGDNGQSLVLGGFDEAGSDLYNPLSRLCMEASLELGLIDPKINLRVGENTPAERYTFATHLTKAGLGFPQYCNDDVVIPGLMALGYEKADAYDYVVAACWEFIIPGKGADTPNFAGVDFPAVCGRAVREYLPRCGIYGELERFVAAGIKEACDRAVSVLDQLDGRDQPFFSLFFDGCIESLTSMWRGGTKYRNFGAQGLGISVAADLLAAVKKTVFEDKTVTARQLLDALEHNFEGQEPLRNLLLSCPKMGCNDDLADGISCFLTDTYADCMNNRKKVGGVFRAGTGCANHYIGWARQCPATPDGRYAGEAYAASFSPSPNAKCPGLLSVIQSFTKQDLKRVINGGPLTLEIHDTVLRNDEGIEKVGQLVGAYIALGGHQLQLNAVNRDRLLDAREHPERYPNLVVRVWGWSGYFCELDPDYQDHIIRRTEYVQ